MKRKNQFSTSNKYWLLILAIICIVLMGLSGFAESGKGPLSWAAGYTIVPMQKGINRVGMWIGDVSENFATLQEIKKENKELKSRLEEMTTAIAFVISPEYLIPPSAIIGIPDSFAAS